MANEPKLKPCCGQVAEIKYFAGLYGNKIYQVPHYEIKCAICFSGVHVDVLKLTERGRDEAKKHAINLWNRRNAYGTAK